MKKERNLEKDEKEKDTKKKEAVSVANICKYM
jgi:hypothetical protein